MKVRVVLTVEIPDSEARHLKQQKSYAGDAQVRDFIREQVWSAAKRSDWLRDLEADITREN